VELIGLDLKLPSPETPAGMGLMDIELFSVRPMRNAVPHLLLPDTRVSSALLERR
jgi:hypothetical protein